MENLSSLRTIVMKRQLLPLQATTKIYAKREQFSQHHVSTKPENESTCYQGKLQRPKSNSKSEWSSTVRQEECSSKRLTLRESGQNDPKHVLIWKQNDKKTFETGPESVQTRDSPETSHDTRESYFTPSAEHGRYLLSKELYPSLWIHRNGHRITRLCVQ